MTQLDPRAFDSSINFSPLLGALQNYRQGMDQEYKWKGQQALGTAIANKDYQGAQAAAGQYGMDLSVLMQVGEFGRQAQERDRQAEALKNPLLTQGLQPGYAAALETLAPEQRAAQLAQAQSPVTQSQLATAATGRQLSQAQLAQLRNQTPEVRATMAQGLGLKPGTYEHNAFVATGQIVAPQAPKSMEVNGKVISIPPNGGPVSTIYDGGPNFDKLPEFAAKAAGFTSRMVESENNTRKIMADKNTFDPTTVNTGLVRSMLPEAIGNVVARSGPMQQYEQSAEQWIRAFLRKESGAAIGKDEFARDFKVYFPQPGDGPEVVKQKERARLDAMRSFQMETRGFFDHASPEHSARLKGWQTPTSPDAPKPDGANAASRPVPVVNSPEDAARLPSGTIFKTPDGRTMQVP